jgi:hypothetical protein
VNALDKISLEKENLNIKSSRKYFVRTPEGQKTPKMIEVEKKIGRTLEEDFQEYHVEKGWGQIRMAKRWGVKRNTIFYSIPRSGQRSWVEMLNLPVRCETTAENDTQTSITESCEICGISDVSLDDAHWFPDRDGGSTKSHNILKLCPNCHRKLDRGDPVTVELCRERLLFREVKKLIESNSATSKRLRNLVEAILHRKQLE